jgi:Mycobacterium membrane protein
MRVFRGWWLPIVATIAVAITAVGVYELRGEFGGTETTREGSGLANDRESFNPKRVTYDVFGVEGALATISYLDLDARTQLVEAIRLPWSVTLTTTSPTAMTTLLAQSDHDSVSCRITVNGEVKGENTTHGVHALTFCLAKSA